MLGDNPLIKMQIKHVVLVARLIIGGLFIYASMYKVLNPADFAVTVRNYTILPVEWTNLVAITLPWVELGSGLFLVLGVSIRPSALLTTGMMAVFLGALIYAYSVGLDIDCGCFSASTESSAKIGPLYLIRDTLLLLTSAFILFFDSGDYSLV